MDETTAAAEAETSEQGSYISDALESYLGDGEPEAQPPKEEKTETEVNKAQPPKVEDTENKPAAVAPVAADPIDSIFKNDRGEFDVNEFMKFTLPENLTTPEPVDTTTQKATAGNQQVDDRPEWKKDLEEVQNYEKTLKGHVLEPLEKVAQLIQSGVEPMEALNRIYAERQTILTDHLAEYKHQREFDREEKRQKSIADAERQSVLKVRAGTNVNSIVAALPGTDNKAKTELFSHIMFSKAIGAPILNREFMRRYPDVNKLPQAEQEKTADKFLLEIQSDRAELAYYWQLCMDRATRLKQKDAAQRHRLMGAAQANETRLAAQKHPAGPYNRQKQKTESSTGWDGYFGSADRV